MIDKKTYEDLMSYLVKAEVKRLQHNIDQTPNQSGLLKPSHSNSNLNSIHSSKQKQKSSPKPSQQNTSGKKSKVATDDF
jgi:hypothetical protein